MLKAMNDPREMAELELGTAANEYMKRLLTLLQIIQVSRELYGEEEAEKMTKPYTAAMALIGDNMNAAVEKFNKEHGEV